MRMHGVTVALNPEAEFQKWMNYTMSLAQFPVIGNRLESLWELLRNALRSGRVPGRNKILPPMQQLLLEQQQAMQAQSAMAQEAQQVQEDAMMAEKMKVKMVHAKNAVEAEGLQAKRMKQKIDMAKTMMSAMEKSKNGKTAKAER